MLDTFVYVFTTKLVHLSPNFDYPIVPSMQVMYESEKMSKTASQTAQLILGDSCHDQVCALSNQWVRSRVLYCVVGQFHCCWPHESYFGEGRLGGVRLFL